MTKKMRYNKIFVKYISIMTIKQNSDKNVSEYGNKILKELKIREKN